MKVCDYFYGRLLLLKMYEKILVRPPFLTACVKPVGDFVRQTKPTSRFVVDTLLPSPSSLGMFLNAFCNFDIFLSRVLYVIFINTLLYLPCWLFQYNRIIVAPPAVNWKSCATKSHRSIPSRKSGYTIEMFHLDIVFLKIHHICTLIFTHTHISAYFWGNVYD